MIERLGLTREIMKDKFTIFLILLVGGTPIVKYGLTPDLNDTERSSFGYSYESSDMCEEPANSTGFWNPGYTYDIVLRYLLPNTRYYYSYGVEGVW